MREIKLKDIIYTHEHITIDLSKEKGDIDCNLNIFQETKNELINLKNKGVSKIIDLTNRGMGRNIDFILRIQEETGIEIICSTGYYKEPFLPAEVSQLTVDELASIMIKEIEVGINGTEKKASIIGEIGTSLEKITDLEKKVFLAAIKASKKTGKYISTHTTLGRLAHEQLDIFENEGLNLSKVILGHVDLKNDFEYLESLLKRGAYVAFDTIGKIKYLPDETRVEYIKKLCDAGWTKQLLLSVDLTRRSHLKINGGIGYEYLIDNFIPKLIAAGVSKDKIETMVIKNPKRILEDKE